MRTSPARPQTALASSRSRTSVVSLRTGQRAYSRPATAAPASSSPSRGARAPAAMGRGERFHNGERSILSMSLRNGKSFSQVASGFFGYGREFKEAEARDDGLSIRERALLPGPATKGPWAKVRPMWGDPIFNSANSSFGRELAAQVGPTPKPPSSNGHCQAEYQRRETQRHAYEDGEFFPNDYQARKQYHRYDRNPTNPTMLRTRWGGRKNALEKGMMIHGKEVPDENGHLSYPELPGNRSDAPIQDRTRPRARVAYGDGKGQKPVPYGTLRLAETTTMSRLISLREQKFGLSENDVQIRCPNDI